MRILLCEDSKTVAMGYGSDLFEVFGKVRGFEFKHCKNMTECEHCLDIFDPDVILLDLILPPFRAHETISRIPYLKKYGADVVVISGMAYTEENVDPCFAAGASDFIPKQSAAERMLHLHSRIAAAYKRSKFNPVRIAHYGG